MAARQYGFDDVRIIKKNNWNIAEVRKRIPN